MSLEQVQFLYMTLLGYLMRVPNNDVRLEICKTLSDFYTQPAPNKTLQSKFPLPLAMHFIKFSWHDLIRDLHGDNVKFTCESISFYRAQSQHSCLQSENYREKRHCRNTNKIIGIDWKWFGREIICADNFTTTIQGVRFVPLNKEGLFR